MSPESTTGNRGNAALLVCVIVVAALIVGWIVGMRNGQQPRYQLVNMVQADQLARLNVVTGEVTFCMWQATGDSTPARDVPYTPTSDDTSMNAVMAKLPPMHIPARPVVKYVCGFTEPLR